MPGDRPSSLAVDTDDGVNGIAGTTIRSVAFGAGFEARAIVSGFWNVAIVGETIELRLLSLWRRRMSLPIR